MSKNVGEFAPYMYWRPFNLANYPQKHFQVYAYIVLLIGWRPFNLANIKFDELAKLNR